jgi:arylsulfatase A-like enzyme
MAPQGYDYSEVLRGQGPYYNPLMLLDKDGDGERDEQVQHTGYTTDIITDLALEWLKNGRDNEKPFMLMFQHKAPHREWAPGPDYLHMYDDVTIPEPPNLFDNYDTRGRAAHEQDMSIAKTMTARDLKLTTPPYLNDEQKKVWNAAYGPKNEAFQKANLQGDDLVRWKYQRYIKDYLRCIASVDDNVGRVLDYLDESGLADNTVVMYASDQGWYLGEHGWYDKRWMYEESFRTPFLVRWPGVIKPGSVNKDDIVSNLDFAQTFLDIAGVKDIPEPMQGASLVPIFKGQTPDDWRKSFYYHYYEFPGAHSVRRHYGVRMGDHKLIHYYNTNEWELFDLKSDPNELTNIYDKAPGEVTTNLKAELDRLRKHYKVPEDTRPVQRKKRQPKKKK